MTGRLERQAQVHAGEARLEYVAVGGGRRAAAELLDGRSLGQGLKALAGRGGGSASLVAVSCQCPVSGALCATH